MASPSADQRRNTNGYDDGTGFIASEDDNGPQAKAPSRGADSHENDYDDDADDDDDDDDDSTHSKRYVRAAVVALLIRRVLQGKPPHYTPKTQNLCFG